jgi:hypothetical protein
LGLAITALLVCALVTFWVRRISRVFEAATASVVFDPIAAAIVADAADQGHVRLIAAKPTSYDDGPSKRWARAPNDGPEAIFLEVVQVPARRAPLQVVGGCSYGYHILRVESADAGQAIAAVLLAIRDATGLAPQIDFAWSERSHTGNLLRFFFFGVGNVPAVTREILRRIEPNSSRRPRVHIG